MPSLLRALRLLSLVVWVGGIVFFAFVVAPVAFHNLPSPHEAGIVVRGTLLVLNKIGFACGWVFLIASFLLVRFYRSASRSAIAQSVLIGLMMILTQYTQVIVNAMEDDRTHAGGNIDAADTGNPYRQHFEVLHIRSERVEGTILFLGLGVCVLLASDAGVRRLTEPSA
ncbi:protein of unknown function [Granulicella pectinivorans]|jgi:hypothetical protein|uniref:TMEM205-like domain-containing protein n=1 Tax=Granulicella pectinivorans TaxID=474950 RepID=A0A1I6MNL6_9BACT|nr:DUF4149 domain-containing protein [Granulicella pectinivorans]SFS17197.1 protein of unknown function [Granulicella pectinivorans]